MSAEKRPERRPRRAPAAPPDAGSLTEAALAALALRPYTRAGLETLLVRKVATWARRVARTGKGEDEVESVVARAREAAAQLCERLVASGLVDDAAFAEHRTARLTRQGKSRRAISAHLVQKGASRELARRATSEGTDDLYAALVLAKKRRLGPFARDADEDATRDEKAATRRKQLSTFARAGFDMATADRVMRMTPDDASDMLALRRAL